ncbi:MAG: 30S ribosomal protein S8 [Candidatus Roizmanbacteria bacterium GW2011_GWA2_35_19]|uniref:Small ribosomal subunit protein uS8 n=1 Tax=Candidatus Roizmanbacteria bacterium GW2011_GWA2_35_19 TaxID=1618478 RepID=A0A0G0EXV9_9BACT|nr:MAG: 30S ribosomal protein S8 [Candidatus Roizmanbacteria bacterium GW2011_GWA2_35_19]
MENSILDLIIRIKNGYMAKKEVIVSPHSKFKEQLLSKLKDLKFIKGYEVEGTLKKNITIKLSLDNETTFTDIEIFSKPGQRHYVSYRELKPIVSGYGFSILSTPLGILTDKEAKTKKVGGELLFNIW